MRDQISTASDRQHLKSNENDSGTLSTEKMQSLCFKSKIVSTIGHIPRLRSNSGTSSYILEIPVNMRGKKILECTEVFEKLLNDSLTLPVPVLESTLFDLSREYYLSIKPQGSLLGVLGTMHPISKLLEIDDINNPKWVDLLERYLTYNRNAFSEHTFLKSFVSFINDLCVVWNLTNIFHYQTRFDQKLEYLGFLDLENLFKGIINTEILWLSIMVNSYPLKEILNEEIKNLAVLLQSVFLNTIYEFMNSNVNYVHLQDSIKPWLSFKNPDLHTLYSFPRPKKTIKPKYQELSTSFFSVLFRKNSTRLKRQLEEFEKAYRIFENSLLLSFCSLFDM